MTSASDPTHGGAGVRPGDVLAGKYRVERVLGAGGMGVVVAATHLQLEERVALKFLLPAAIQNPEAIGRFLREAKAAVRIKGEHVARVSDVGQLENGAPYIVMEYLEGIDLSGWLKTRGPLPVELAVDFVLQACEAIADAHALGIVHRDLKPANLFCVQRSDGQLSIKVLDFGISKVTVPGGGNDMTRTNALVGSPSYMSPEQMQSSKGVDSRTDLWSLGIILFELTTGRLPFEADTVTELAIKIAVEEAPSSRVFRADMPPALAHVISLCLEKDRSRRYQTVGDLAVALKDFGSRRSRASVERVLGTLQQAGLTAAVLPTTGEFRASAPPPGDAPRVSSTAASWGQTGGTSSPGRRAAPFIVLALVVVLGGLAAAGLLFMRKKPEPALTPATASVASQAVEPSAAPSDVPPPVVTLATPEAAAPSVTVAAAVSSPPPAAATPAGRAVTGSPRPAGNPGRSPAATATTAPKASCNPPFFFDSAGHKQYKPECM